jgi:Flp pilus assembly secretin CpaC
VPRPVINSRELTTKLIIEDGATVILGGLIRDRKVKQLSKVPILGDIPLLGIFFRSEREVVEKSNLMIIVRAKIVTPSGQSYYDPPPVDVEAPVGADVRVGGASDEGPFPLARTIDRRAAEPGVVTEPFDPGVFGALGGGQAQRTTASFVDGNAE